MNYYLSYLPLGLFKLLLLVISSKALSWYNGGVSLETVLLLAILIEVADIRRKLFK